MRDKRAVRDPEGTKKAILDGAESVFAERGFAGASIREIARKSGASGPLVLFHFHSKDELYRAVKERIVKGWSEGKGGAIPPEGTAENFIEEMIKTSFGFYRDNPNMVRMANWGRLEGDDAPWSGEEDIHKWYEKSIKEAQARKEIRDDISPMSVTVMICGAVHVWWEYHGHIEEHVKHGSYDMVSDEKYLKDLTSMVLRGLCPQGDRD